MRMCAVNKRAENSKKDYAAQQGHTQMSLVQHQHRTHLCLLQWCKLLAEGLTALLPAEGLGAAAASCWPLSTAKVQLTDVCLILLKHRLQQTAAAAVVCAVGGTLPCLLLQLLLRSEQLSHLQEPNAPTVKQLHCFLKSIIPHWLYFPICSVCI